MKKVSLILISIFVIFCVYWATGRTLMLKALDSQIQSFESQNYDVAHKGLSIGGFPFLFRSSLIEPDIVSPRTISRPWSIKADKLLMQASSINPLNWDIRHRGEARVDLRGPKGERWLFDVRPFSVDIETKLKVNGEIKSISADISRPQIQALIGTLPPIVGIDAAHINLQPSGKDIKYELDITNIFLEQATLPKWQTVFGPKIDSLNAVILAKELQPLNAKDGQVWKAPQNFVGKSWMINWNGNIFTGDFDLSQTENGLAGSIRAEISNLPQIITQFTSAGMFSQQQANSLKIGAALLPKNDKGQQEITFNTRDGYLLLFGQPLYKF